VLTIHTIHSKKISSCRP